MPSSLAFALQESLWRCRHRAGIPIDTLVLALYKLPDDDATLVASVSKSARDLWCVEEKQAQLKLRRISFMASLLSPLTDNDMEEELSIAYLHAACTSARMGMQVTSRSKDNRGVDATINAFGKFGTNDGYLSTVDIDVQLKATVQQPALIKGTHLSYFPNRYRNTTCCDTGHTERHEF